MRGKNAGEAKASPERAMAMKVSNILYKVEVRVGGKVIKIRHFVTEEAKNKYCNLQYSLVGENATCLVYNFNTQNLIETWAA